MRTAGPLVLALAAAAAALALAFAPSSSQAHPCVSGNELWFRAADRTLLVGHRFGGLRPAGRTAVVLAHMSDDDLCAWAPYARALARKGFFVCAFDFRGPGSSHGIRLVQGSSTARAVLERFLRDPAAAIG